MTINMNILMLALRERRELVQTNGKERRDNIKARLTC